MSNLLDVYNRSPIQMVRGDGVYLYDEQGREYLDFAAGIATVGLGHCHPMITAALKNQSDKLWHCSNIFSIPEQQRLASRLVELTFADRVFFCSSGLEATEAAIKMIRRYHYINGNKNRNVIITVDGGFHGRSMAAISAGGSEFAREGYSPLLPGFKKVQRNNIEDLKRTIDENTAGIFLELIQSEGGVYPLDIDYLLAVKELATHHKILLAFDEVQTGYGRTGSLFYYQQLNIDPDILTMAKAMGNGFPLGACLTSEKVASVMKPGTHGSTYGGNPLSMAVGNAVLDLMLAPGFFEEVQTIGKYLQTLLFDLQKKFPSLLKEIRGKGLLFGVEFYPVVLIPELLKLSIKNGIILTKTSEKHTIRIIPPLIITKEHVDKFIEVLRHVLMIITSL